MARKIQLIGAIKILAALGVFLFARAHSPYMSFGQMLSNLNGWMLKPAAYYLILFIAAGLAVWGVLDILNSVKEEKSSEK